jgi:hypothetical protein
VRLWPPSDDNAVFERTYGATAISWLAPDGTRHRLQIR